MVQIVYSEDVIIEIPDFDVRVNGVLIDTEHSQYPLISYKNVTYFPMTSDYLTGIGLDLSFTSKEGLKLSLSDNLGQLEQKFLGANNILGSKDTARLVPFQVRVNGQTIDNSKEAYPVLLYKDITYFPMTWRFAVTEFGWTTSWSNEKGFAITIENKNEGISRLSDTVTINNKVIQYSGLKVDLDKGFKIQSALAHDKIGSTDSLENMAVENNALIAVNGSYFAAYFKDDTPKDPYGILVLDGELAHNGNGRATLGIKDGQVDIDRVDATIRGESASPSLNWTWVAYWMNHTTSENGVTFTIFDKFRGSDTMNFYGKNHVIEDGVVTQVSDNQIVDIPENGYVVNLNGQLGANMTQVYECFEVGNTFSFEYELTPDNEDQKDFWNNLDYATGAGPALLLDGFIDIDFESEGFYEPKILENTAARSAIGYTKDNELIIVTTTATIYELANIMRRLGCYEAMNLDGGASSGLWYKGNYIRKPGRDLSNMIYITK